MATMTKKGPSRKAMRIASALAIAAASVPAAADAQVNKCKQPDGTISFQSAPCAGATRPPVVPKVGTTTPRTSANADAGSDPYAKDGGRWTLPAAPPLPRGQTAQAATPQSMGPRTPAGDPHRAEDAQTRAENERIAAENARTEAYNKQVRCNNARGNLAVLKGGHAVYRADNNGDRHFIDDKDRDRETANAQQNVNAECN